MDPALNIHDSAEPVETSHDVVIDSDVFELIPRPSPTGFDLAPGARISENVRLISLLRTGGMGNVWLAEHEGLGTRVAVKFMSSELAADPACVARFSREAKLAARMKSPHVVNILDYSTTAAGVPYIVMELLDGEDLEMRLRAGQRPSLEDSSRILMQICKALSRAHELGIVHRDIKPDNVFLVKQEGEFFVQLLDFGIARDEDKVQEITVSGMTMGTPAYMSPEQLFRPKDVDHRSDLWSAAVVAYRCLTGELPFEGDTFGTMCISVHDGAFPAPSMVEPSLPRGLDAWFQKALSLDPDARFQSASEMANAYLAELENARLLPRWAAPSGSMRALTIYSSDPGGISGGPIVFRRPRRLGVRALVLSSLVGVLVAVAALPQGDALHALIDSWVEAVNPDVPRLNPTADEAPLVFDQSPRWLPPPSPRALSRRDPYRPLVTPALIPRRIYPRNPYDPGLNAATPNEGPSPASTMPSAVFGI